MSDDDGPEFELEECHIPSFNGHGMELTGDYFIVRRAKGRLKGYPLIITGHAEVAEWLMRTLNSMPGGEEALVERWAHGPPVAPIVETKQRGAHR